VSFDQRVMAIAADPYNTIAYLGERGFLPFYLPPETSAWVLALSDD
jgi:hypothetical protein